MRVFQKPAVPKKKKKTTTNKKKKTKKKNGLAKYFQVVLRLIQQSS